MGDLIGSLSQLFGLGGGTPKQGSGPAPTNQPGMDMMGPPDLEKEDGGLAKMLMSLFGG